MFEPSPAARGSAPDGCIPALAHWADTLNPAQREAVYHGGGPLLVVAGAGTGKTWTLACRVACLVEQGVAPERILLLTFTRRAAQEMVARAGRLTGQAEMGQVWGGTFHAVANRLLRLYGRPVCIRPDFTLLDQADAADLLDLLRDELGLGGR
jgi:DNA helicase-2/ATP-dependent DNA helicase PcrA